MTDIDRPGRSAARSRRGRVQRSSSTRRCTRRRCSTCGIGCRSIRSGGRPATRRARTDAVPAQRMDRDPGGRATLGVDRDAIAVRLGQRAPGVRARRSRRSRSSGTTSRTRSFSSSSRPAATRSRNGGAPEDWAWVQVGPRRASAVLGARARRRWLWRGHVRSASRCRWRGRST